jgi:hypothetical protein
VTGINAQIILIHLLITEYKTAIFTQGPHNSMFRSTTEGGFEIDEPIDIESLYLRNFVPVEILDDIGEHIVCLNVRRESHQLQTWRTVKCLGHRGLEETVEENGVVKLSMQSLEIRCVLGAYIGKTQFGGTKSEESEKDWSRPGEAR